MSVLGRIRQAAQAVRDEVGARPDSSPQGVALLLVMMTLAVTGAFAAEYNYKAYIRMHVAANLRNEVVAYYHARGAMEVARLVIKSQNVADNMLNMAKQFNPKMGKQNVELWTFSSAFANAFCTGKLKLMGREVFDFKGLGGVGVGKGGFCTAQAKPEDGRININRVDDVAGKGQLFGELYRELIRHRDPDEPPLQPGEVDKDMAEIALNVIDWADADTQRADLVDGRVIDGTQGEGLGYDKGYSPKDAKFDTLAELQLVDKMAPELYCKLAPQLTPYSPEKMNVNTASNSTLRGLLCDPANVSNVQEACYTPGPLLGLPPVHFAVGCLDFCRTLRQVFLSPGFSNTTQFMNVVGQVQQLPEIGPGPAIRGNAMKQKIGVKSRVIRLEALGGSYGTFKGLTAVIDTSTGEYIYWREY